jgi:outer membrane protein TolC
VRLQKARFEEVVAAYQNKVLTAAEEVENGMATFLKSQEQVKFLAESVVEAKKARQIGVAEFEGGKTDFTRLAVLELNLVQQQLLLSQAQGDVALGLIQVYRALGGGWQIRCDESAAKGVFPPACALPVEGAAATTGVRARFGTPQPEPTTDDW